MQVTTTFSSTIPKDQFESLKKESQSYKIGSLNDQKIFAIVAPTQKSEKSKKINAGQDNVVCLYNKFIGGMYFGQMATGKTTLLDADKKKDFDGSENYIPKPKESTENKEEKADALKIVTTKYYLGEYLSIKDIITEFDISDKEFVTNCKLFSRFKAYPDRIHTVRNRVFRHHLVVNEQWVYVDTAIQVLSVMKPEILGHIKSHAFALFDRPSNFALTEKAKEVANYDYHIFAVKHTKPKAKGKNQEISYSMKELKNEEDLEAFDPAYVIKIAKSKDVKKITAIAIKRLLGGDKITPKMTAKEETKIIPKTREEFIQKVGLIISQDAENPNDRIYTSQKLYDVIKQTEAETAEKRKANKESKDSSKKQKVDSEFNAPEQKGTDVVVHTVPEEQTPIADECIEAPTLDDNEEADEYEYVYEEVEEEVDEDGEI